MINELIKLANLLDKRGLYKEADYLDGLISKIANDLPEEEEEEAPREKGLKFAWWTSKMGWLPYRNALIHQGEHALLRLYDRLVQGESVDALISELEAEVAERNAEYDQKNDDNSSSFYRRDRYGHTYPDYESMRWHNKHTSRLENHIERMRKGTFGPTHTIQEKDGGKKWDYDTVEEWAHPIPAQ